MEGSILIVEDERVVGWDIQTKLEGMDYEVSGIVASGEEALAKVEVKRPDLVLMDIRLEGNMDGIEAADIIREKYNLPVIFLTAYVDEDTLGRAKITQPFGYLLKPFDERQLHTTIKMALYKHKMENALRESEARFRYLADEMVDGAAVVIEGVIEWVNKAITEMTGYEKEELVGRRTVFFGLPEENPKITEWLNARLSGNKAEPFLETKIKKKNGELIDISLSAKGIVYKNKEAVQLLVRDVTVLKRAEEERRRLEDKIQEAHRIESLIVLAGGIAHEFNNLLQGILGNAGLAMMDLPADSPILESLRIIEKSTHKGAALTKQMLDYSGGGGFILQKVNISDLVLGITHLIEVIGKNKVGVKYDLKGAMPLVEADLNQMKQLVLSLVSNAVEAYGEDEGVVRIITSSAVYSSDYFNEANVGKEMGSEEYAVLEVSDAGCGMEEDLVRKIFDPFFSTKFLGRGLGLAAVQGIVRGQKGAIMVASKPDEGTIVRVYFPVV